MYRWPPDHVPKSSASVGKGVQVWQPGFARASSTMACVRLCLCTHIVRQAPEGMWCMVAGSAVICQKGSHFGEFCIWRPAQHLTAKRQASVSAPCLAAGSVLNSLAQEDQAPWKAACSTFKS